MPGAFKLCPGNNGKSLTVHGETSETQNKGGQRHICRIESHSLHGSNTAAQFKQSGQKTSAKAYFKSARAAHDKSRGAQYAKFVKQGGKY